MCVCVCVCVCVCTQTAPPQPKAPELGLLSVNPQDVWVQTFGGYVHEREVLAQVCDGVHMHVHTTALRHMLCLRRGEVQRNSQ